MAGGPMGESIQTMEWHKAGEHASFISNSTEPQVLFFPGLGEGGRVAEAALRHFAERGLPVAALDLSYDGTTQKDIDTTLIEGPMSVVEALGQSNMHVVGNSKGSGEAARAAVLAEEQGNKIYNSFGLLAMPGLSDDYLNLAPEARVREFRKRFIDNMRKKPWGQEETDVEPSPVEKIEEHWDRLQYVLGEDAMPYAAALLDRPGHRLGVFFNAFDRVFGNSKTRELFDMNKDDRLFVDIFGAHHVSTTTSRGRDQMAKVIDWTITADFHEAA